MQRREFLKAAGAVSLVPSILPNATFGADATSAACCGPGYASPADAISDAVATHWSLTPIRQRRAIRVEFTYEYTKPLASVT